MARLFYASVCAGILLTILAAGVFPMPRHARFPSSITGSTFIANAPLMGTSAQSFTM